MGPFRFGKKKSHSQLTPSSTSSTANPQSQPPPPPPPPSQHPLPQIQGSFSQNASPNIVQAANAQKIHLFNSGNHSSYHEQASLKHGSMAQSSNISYNNSGNSNNAQDLSFSSHTNTPRPSGGSYRRINSTLPSPAANKSPSQEVMSSPISLINSNNSNNNIQKNSSNTFRTNDNYNRDPNVQRKVSQTSTSVKASPNLDNSNLHSTPKRQYNQEASTHISQPHQYQNYTEPSPWNRIKLPVSPFPRYRHVASSHSTNDTNEIYVIGGLHDQSVYGDTWTLKYSKDQKLPNSNYFFDNDHESLSSAQSQINRSSSINRDSDSNNSGKLLFQSRTVDISDATPPPRVGHAATLCGNAFVIFGGDTHKLNNNGMMDDDVYLLNINSMKWTIPTQVGPRPLGRYGHKINVIQDLNPQTNQITTKLYVFGGQFDDTYFNDLCCYDLSSFRKPDSHWIFLKPKTFIPPPVTNHSMCVYDNKLWVFGGDTPQGLLNTVFMYDPWKEDWCIVPTTTSKFTDSPPPPIQEHASIVYKNLMFVFGGKDENDIYLNDLWILNFKTLEWWKFPNMKRGNNYIPSPRSGHSLTLLAKENKLLIMGGDKLDYSLTPDLDDTLNISETTDYGYGSILYTFDLLSLEKHCPGIFDEHGSTENESSSVLDLRKVSEPLEKPVGVDSATHGTSPNRNLTNELQEQSEDYNKVANLKEVELPNVVENNEDENEVTKSLTASPIANNHHSEMDFFHKGEEEEEEEPIDSRRSTTISEKANQRGVSDFFDTYADESASILVRSSYHKPDTSGGRRPTSGSSSMLLTNMIATSTSVVPTTSIDILTGAPSSDFVIHSEANRDVHDDSNENSSFENPNSSTIIAPSSESVEVQRCESFPLDEELELHTADATMVNNVPEVRKKNAAVLVGLDSSVEQLDEPSMVLSNKGDISTTSDNTLRIHHSNSPVLNNDSDKDINNSRDLEDRYTESTPVLENKKLNNPVIVRKSLAIETSQLLEELATELLKIKMDTYKHAQTASDKIKQLEMENIKLKSLSEIDVSNKKSFDNQPKDVVALQREEEDNKEDVPDYKEKYLAICKEQETLKQSLLKTTKEAEKYKSMYHNEKLKMISLLKTTIMNLEDEVE